MANPQRQNRDRDKSAAAPVPDRADFDRLKPLRRLADRKADIGAYYRSLLRHDDELIRIGATCWLLDNQEFVQRARTAARSLGPYPCLRARVPDLFKGNCANPGETLGAGIDAQSDSVAQAVAEPLERFRQTGDASAMLEAAKEAETAAGWRAGLEWSTRAMLLYSVDPHAAIRTFEILTYANKPDQVAVFRDLLAEFGMFPALCKLESAGLLVEKSEHRAAMNILDTMSHRKLNRAPLRRRLHALRGACQASLGQFEDAVRSYEMANTDGRHTNHQLMARLPDQVKILNALDVTPPAADRNDNHFMMLGFPRSGTTLLESALSAHPAIETFEEVRAFSQMAHNLKDAVVTNGTIDAGDLSAMREGYYRDLEALMTTPEAAVFIDKTPIRSVYGPLLRRLFPQKRYIFSIRHPYDVVLSCFRTQFGANMSMIHFNRFPDACALYDVAMTNWFEAYPETDTAAGPRRPDIAAEISGATVCTVRYERLVTDFETEIGSVLTFLGVPWDDSVTRFAEAAKQRRAKTPSYTKVRKGLGIGVQTAWQDFRFLFETPPAEPLKRWVNRFGYEGL